MTHSSNGKVKTEEHDVTTFDDNYEIIEDEPQTEPPLDTTERQLIEEHQALQSRDALCLSDEVFEIIDDEEAYCQAVPIDETQDALPSFSNSDSEACAQHAQRPTGDARVDHGIASMPDLVPLTIRDLLHCRRPRLCQSRSDGLCNADNTCVAESVAVTRRNTVGDGDNHHQRTGIKEKRRKVSDVVHYDRVIIEWCCGHDSMLGRPSTYSDGCKVIRLTIDDDLCTMEELQKALRIVQDCPGGRTLLWSSMPRAGGSPLQMLNSALGQGVEKIAAHWRDFRFLWDHFVIVARAVVDICGVIAIEWPETCRYWKEPQVEQFVEKHNFHQSVFHGCACRLVTKYNLPLGQALKKPWACSSSDLMVLSHLSDKCQGGHSHAECRGRDCEASEDYTPAVINAIHEGFRLCRGPSDQKVVEQRSSHVLSPAELSMSCVEHHMFMAAKCRRSSQHSSFLRLVHLAFAAGRDRRFG
jgi:hypothetical protein